MEENTTEVTESSPGETPMPNETPIPTKVKASNTTMYLVIILVVFVLIVLGIVLYLIVNLNNSSNKTTVQNTNSQSLGMFSNETFSSSGSSIANSNDNQNYIQKSFANARNSQRRSDINAILGVLNQSFIDFVIPARVTDCGVANAGAKHIGTGVGLVNLSTPEFVPTYISSIPMDPQGGNQGDTLYSVCTIGTPPTRYRVLTPNAENGVAISVER